MATTANLNTGTFDAFVRLAPYEFTKAVESIEQSARNSGLFVVEMFPSNTGNTREYNEFDTEEYAKKKSEGDQAEQLRVQMGYTKVGRLTRFGEDIGISWEMRNEGKYTDALRKITSLAKLTTNRMDLDLTHRFTFGTSSTYTNMDGDSVDVTVGDGSPLFYSAHPLKGTSVTFRNRLTADPTFSTGALEAMQKQTIENTLNQFGEMMTATFDKIWCFNDPATINRIKETMQATAGISSPNNGVPNVYKASYDLVVLKRGATTATGTPDTTKSKWWGIASSTLSSGYLSILEETNLREPDSVTKQLGTQNYEDVSTDNIEYSVRSTYMICVAGAKWVHASCPTT